ncbi:uncharacterized protein FIESC28_02619 [Fusarium coffeatum]|uniref:Uncharacterized protein n=1 Tax=Fusarium coffeatum TaxID=231269 RepID=A0A366S5I5_9HYPO|nr:uncharacterized protein FIESC28_02619 [Fusarium coffeatum]RBR24569.1 hypothetical protein FIESC28_02619 [Fusarium coffeatum]
MELEDFDFWDSDGYLTGKDVSDEQRNTLYNLLNKDYGATDVLESFPFLIIGCSGGPPDKKKRPFSVAGAIAIWRDAEHFDFRPIVGDLGQGDPIEVDNSILDQIKPLEVPSNEVILHLANHWPESQAISMLWTTLVVELPLVNQKAHRDRLRNLPSGIECCFLNLTFNNGPLPNSERNRTREIKPDPTTYGQEICDETDYVAMDGKFYPGTMIGSVDEEGELCSVVTAGILIEKGDEQRLTCSFHCWEDQHKKHPNQFGNSDDTAMETFKVLQGNNPGSTVGYVKERMGQTDIALAKLHDDGVVFENKFMEIEAAPKKFLASADHNFGDRFIFDSFAVGKQTVSCLGRRFTLGWKQETTHPDVKYIALDQGAFVSDSPEITTEPQIRDSVCGSVLLRCLNQSLGNKHHRTQKMTIEDGEIGGMLHWVDIQSNRSDKIENFIMYADSFDPLIEAGWTIVQETNEDSHSDGEASEQSPRKRQRT